MCGYIICKCICHYCNSIVFWKPPPPLPEPPLPEPPKPELYDPAVVTEKVIEAVPRVAVTDLVVPAVDDASNLNLNVCPEVILAEEANVPLLFTSTSPEL